jgi:uncharacterized protein (DUF1697 family)
MPRYVAFLRAVNLGSRRRVTSEGLRACFEEMAFTEVACFRTSGNVIFASESGEPRTITDRAERGLAERLGFEVPVFLRSEGEVRAIAENEPFDTEVVGASKGKLQVSLLAAKPSAAARKQALALATDEDLLAISGRELYWLPSGGTQQSDLDQAALERQVGPATIRTKGTVEQIAAKFF